MSLFSPATKNSLQNLQYRPRRIMIFGRPGSGKSTFSLALSRSLNLPLFHLDKVFFTDHWVEREYSEFLNIQKEYVSQSHWIIDGNATRSLNIRGERADFIVYFYRPSWLCALRIFKRMIFSKNSHIDDRAPNCPERLSWKLFAYMYSFPSRVASFLDSISQSCDQRAFVQISSNQQASELISILENLPEYAERKDSEKPL